MSELEKPQPGEVWRHSPIGDDERLYLVVAHGTGNSRDVRLLNLQDGRVQWMLAEYMTHSLTWRRHS